MKSRVVVQKNKITISEASGYSTELKHKFQKDKQRDTEALAFARQLKAKLKKIFPLSLVTDCGRKDVKMQRSSVDPLPVTKK